MLTYILTDISFQEESIGSVPEKAPVYAHMVPRDKFMLANTAAYMSTFVCILQFFLRPEINKYILLRK